MKLKQEMKKDAKEVKQALEKADDKLHVTGYCKQCLEDVKEKVDDALNKSKGK